MLLLGAFSVTARAESVEVKPYEVQIYGKLTSSVGTWDFDTISISPDSLTGEHSITTRSISRYEWNNYINWQTVNYYRLYNIDDSPVVPSGNKVTINFNSVYYSFLYYAETSAGPTAFNYANTPDSVNVLVKYVDGTAEYVDSVTFTQSNTKYTIDIHATFEPKKNVSMIEFQVAQKVKPGSNFYSLYETLYINNYLGEFTADGDYQYGLEIHKSSEEAGLLSGILGWIENIWDSVTDGFTDMKNGITNIVNKITDLPRLLWEKIETGLKNLFVPDDEYIVGYKDRWDSLLEDRLGAVYEVVNVTFESWEKINVSDATNTVDMPKVTIPLPDDEEFSFGGFPVKIVAEGFEVLITACKLIVGIVCTIMFVNGLRKRYDEVMGVEQ